MYKKLLSNLPFHPTLIHQITFYAKRLHKEESIRRLGFIFIAIAMLLQLFAFMYPPKASLATSDNDVIRGGSISSLSDLLNRYDNQQDVRQLFSVFGVEREQLASMTSNSTVSSSLSAGARYLSVGRHNYGTTYQEFSFADSDNDGMQEHFYMRTLHDGAGQRDITFQAFKGKNRLGQDFWVLKDCGNITTDGWIPPAQTVATPAAPAPPSYEGYVDTVSCEKIVGWARNRSSLQDNVLLEINFISASGNKTIVQTSASQPRSDLGGNYGFSYVVGDNLKNGTTYSVVVYAISGNGNNPTIPNGGSVNSAQITCQPPAQPQTGITATIYSFCNDNTYGDVTNGSNKTFTIRWARSDNGMDYFQQEITADASGHIGFRTPSQVNASTVLLYVELYYGIMKISTNPTNQVKASPSAPHAPCSQPETPVAPITPAPAAPATTPPASPTPTQPAIVVPVKPNLQIVKTSLTNGDVAPGQDITYRIAYRNTGPGPAYEMYVRDRVPNNTTFRRINYPSEDYRIEGSDVVWWHHVDRKLLGVSDYWHYVEVTVRVNAGTPSGTRICNTATITSDNGAYKTDSDTTSACNTVAATAALTPTPTPAPKPPSIKPVPTASCTLLRQISKPTRTKRIYATQADATNGATISGYIYEFVKSDGSSRQIKNAASSQQANETEWDFGSVGTYTVSVTVKTSIGNVSSTACKLTENVDKAPTPALPILKKRVRNITRNLEDANRTTAQAGDTLEYILTTTNDGETDAPNYLLEQEDLADVLLYADIVNLGDGQLNTNTKIVRWPKTTLKAKSTIEKRITVRIKSTILSTPASPSNPAGYNLVLSNAYGPIHTDVYLPASTAKAVENLIGTVDVLPRTGSSGLLLGFIISVTAGFFLSRSRLLGKELELVRDDFAAGGGF